jgi:hypothetical protein
MEVTYQFQEEAGLDALTSRLSNVFKWLALNLEAAAQGGLPIHVNLYRILNQCSELDPLRSKIEYKLGHTASVDGFLERDYSRAAGMICCGRIFQDLKGLLGDQQNPTWDIKLATIDRRKLRAHDRTREEDNWLESRESHAVETYLEVTASALNTILSHRVDFTLNVTDHKAINEYCVLGLFQNMLVPLPAAEVLAGADGALYVRGGVKSVWGERAKYLFPHIFIRYEHNCSTRMHTWRSLTYSTGEPQAVGEPVIEGRERWDHLPNKPSDFSAFAGAAALDPYPVMPNNEVCHNPASSCQEVPSSRFTGCITHMTTGRDRHWRIPRTACPYTG